ncbi:MAG TPA: ATP-binding protein [Acidimicrobiales bacterium]|nr:ATP-binding protein [Acidimicrobiales bacterium]
MAPSPFPYHGPLEPAQVQGRDELVSDLIERVGSRRVTALLGPRRYGKTSVLRRVAAELTGTTTVWVDLYEVTSMPDVAVRFDDALAATTGRFARAARHVSAGLALNLGAVKVELTGPARSRPDADLTFHRLLDVLVATAAEEPTLLVVDEFSSIARVKGAAGALRTAVQHHYRELGIVFAGSHPSMMRTLFTSRAEPFYGQADLVEIGALDAAAVSGIVGSGFAATGRDAGHVAGLIASFTAGHPQRTMQLADACWRHTPPGGTAGPTTWSAALDEVRRSTAEGMERLYSGFERGERSVLRAVARGGSIYGAEAGLLELSTGTATHARRALLDSGDLVDTDAGLRVVDPLLADWLRERFPI